MGLDYLKQSERFVTGSKQTLKAIETGKAERVVIARDAEERILRPILEKCTQHNVPVSYADSMEELGKACGIKVGAAMAAVLTAG